MNNTESKPTEQEYSFASPEQRAEGLRTVQGYLQKAQTATNGVVWNVHVFCRVGDGEDHRYEELELENTKHFIDRLINFFLSDDNAERYNQSVAWKMNELADYLPRLKELFEGLMEDDVCTAELDEMEADSIIKVKEADRIAEKYEWKTRLVQAQRAIIPLMTKQRSQRA